MTVSTQETTGRLVVPRKRRLGRELVVEAFFGPLADRTAIALAPLRVPPTVLVLANGAAGLLAALALMDRAFVAAAVLLQLKTLLDNADGRLARVSGKVTLLGRYLDTEVDLAVNVVLFAALGWVTGEPVLALAAFVALTLVLSVNFNLAELTARAHDLPKPVPASSGAGAECRLRGLYEIFFGPQDRLIRGFSEKRLERLLEREPDAATTHAATLAYYDRVTAAVLANLGLSTQLVVLGACLVAGLPGLYLWLVVATPFVLPLLQLRRERLVRRALSAPRAA
jgi:archaetidylinositol phosphate synthase